jgi:hypothetical protein
MNIADCCVGVDVSVHRRGVSGEKETVGWQDEGVEFFDQNKGALKVAPESLGDSL